MFRSEQHSDSQLFELCATTVRFHKTLFLLVFLIRMILISNGDPPEKAYYLNLFY